jgi:integrase/recombinase XerD
MSTPDRDADPEELWLAWDPSVHIPVADLVDPSHPLVNLNRVKYPGKGKTLEVYLRPLVRLSLPGQEELERYVLHKYRRNMKENTLRSTVSDGKLFLLFMQRTGRQKMGEVTREDVEAFVEHEQDRGMTAKSVKKRLACVYSLLDFLNKEGLVDREVLTRKIQIKLPEALPRAMAPEDVSKLLSVIQDVQDRAMILVLLRTGMRIGELLGTKLIDVHLKERRIEIPQAQKNAVGRVVYISEDARAALEAWMRVRDENKSSLFYAQGRRSMGYAAARTRFVKYLVKAGVDRKGYTLHCLRHTFASEMLNAGMRLECLQQLLGHSSVEVTRRYARLTDKSREEEYFRAMEIIERGGIHGHYELDPELQAFLKEEKLLD